MHNRSFPLLKGRPRGILGGDKAGEISRDKPVMTRGGRVGKDINAGRARPIDFHPPGLGKTGGRGERRRENKYRRQAGKSRRSGLISRR